MTPSASTIAAELAVEPSDLNRHSANSRNHVENTMCEELLQYDAVPGVHGMIVLVDKA
jgi:hypothetical protein